MNVNVLILKHGNKVSEERMFYCKCGCLFKTTEYKRNCEYGFLSKCPECRDIVSVIPKHLEEQYLIDLKLK